MVSITEFEFAAAIIADSSDFKRIVDNWGKRDGGGFSPYSQTVRNVLSGCVDPSSRGNILEKIQRYKAGARPERNAMLTSKSWEFFDLMGAEVTGAAPYSVSFTNIEVKIRGGYICRQGELEYYVVNWFNQRVPSERIVRSILDVLQSLRPTSWPATRVSALLMAESQDLRLAGPLPPARQAEIDARMETLGRQAS